jgi:hypothetical protein
MLEQDVAALLAREAIRDLPLRYCDCVWQNNIDGLAELFTEDGSFAAIVKGTETKVSGRANLADFYKNAISFMPRPFIHNHVIDMTGADTASGRCYLDLRSGRNNMDILGAGYYEDEYKATPDGWKFQSRRFTALRMDEIPEGFATE